MLQIKSFQVNPLMENCYVVSDDTKEACIIDCGCMTENDWDSIKNYIKEKQLKPVHLLCTHLHFDHIMGCGFPKRDYDLDIEGSRYDIELYNQKDLYIDAFGLGKVNLPPLPKVVDISTKKTIEFGNHQFQILLTPGHSQGGICFYCKEEDVVFAGDTIFRASVGRTDMPGGSQYQLIQSIKTKLFELPTITTVFVGHGPSTTIEYELNYNPYI